MTTKHTVKDITGLYKCLMFIKHSFKQFHLEVLKAFITFIFPQGIQLNLCMLALTLPWLFPWGWSIFHWLSTCMFNTTRIILPLFQLLFLVNTLPLSCRTLSVTALESSHLREVIFRDWMQKKKSTWPSIQVSCVEIYTKVKCWLEAKGWKEIEKKSRRCK